MGRRKRRKDERLRLERTITAHSDTIRIQRDMVCDLTSKAARSARRQLAALSAAFALGLLIGWLVPW